ncbi:MAG: peptidoglycan DD-metalloendopeptidase family protein [Lysobacterales bacterium]
MSSRFSVFPYTGAGGGIRALAYALLVALLLLTACTSDRTPTPGAAKNSQRDIYRDTLAKDPQAFRVLATRWGQQGEAALQSPIPVSLPYVEYQTARVGTPSAAAYRFPLDVDEILEIEVRRGAGAAGGLIVDLLRSDGSDWVSVLSLEPTESLLRYRPDVVGTFAVRAQATLESTGIFALGLVRKSLLEFPVQTDSRQSVLSFFGAERDAGRRVHHGIDIFAPRGTPVLAAHDGMVVRVGESPKGGLHIWQRSVEGSLYYAHLDSVAVESGDLVARGEIIGGVGNSGNARTTNPHLHFGVYQRWTGPLDPLPLTGSQRIPDPWLESLVAAPQWMRSRSDTVTLNETPAPTTNPVEKITENQLVRVLARSGEWVRVMVSSGAQGYVAEQHLGPPGRIQTQTDSPAILHLQPHLDAPQLTPVTTGTRYTARGQFGQFTWIETDSGLVGWLRAAPSSYPSPNGS